MLTQQPSPGVNGVHSDQAIQEIRGTANRPRPEVQAYRWLQSLPDNLGLICGIWYCEDLLASFSRRRPQIILAYEAKLAPAAECAGGCRSAGGQQPPEHLERKES